MVLAGTKAVIKSFAASARVLPVLIHFFQPVPKTYLLWNSQTQSRIANLQIGCSRGQGQVRRAHQLVCHSLFKDRIKTGGGSAFVEMLAGSTHAIPLDAANQSLPSVP